MTEFKGRFILPRRPSPPSSPLTGELYLDTDDDNIYQWDGAAWVEVGAGGGGAVTSVNTETGAVVLDAADVGALPTSHETDETSVHGIADTGTLVVAVVHGAVAGTARPSAPDVVYWIGSVEPTNAAANDIWHDTTASAGTGPSFRGIVTSLPSSPVTGDMAILVDNKTTPTYRWQIVYNGDSSSSYKWEVVGGNPLFAEVETSQTRASTSYGDLTTVGPTVTLPVAGDYDVTVGFTFWGSAATVCHMSYAIGATAAVDADSVKPGVDSGSDQSSATRTRRKTGLTAVALTSKYRMSNAATGNIFDRRISAMPVRIG